MDETYEQMNMGEGIHNNGEYDSYRWHNEYAVPSQLRTSSSLLVSADGPPAMSDVDTRLHEHRAVSASYFNHHSESMESVRTPDPSSHHDHSFSPDSYPPEPEPWHSNLPATTSTFHDSFVPEGSLPTHGLHSQHGHSIPSHNFPPPPPTHGFTSYEQSPPSSSSSGTFRIRPLGTTAVVIYPPDTHTPLNTEPHDPPAFTNLATNDNSYHLPNLLFPFPFPPSSDLTPSTSDTSHFFPAALSSAQNMDIAHHEHHAQGQAGSSSRGKTRSRSTRPKRALDPTRPRKRPGPSCDQCRARRTQCELWPGALPREQDCATCPPGECTWYVSSRD